METTFKERSVLSHAIYSRIFWIDELLDNLKGTAAGGLYQIYSEEKAILENILNKLHEYN